MVATQQPSADQVSPFFEFFAMVQARGVASGKYDQYAVSLEPFAGRVVTLSRRSPD